MDFEDPALFRVGGRESWHVGSALEVLSSSDRRWHVGWVMDEDSTGLLRVMSDDHCQELMRRDDARLAPMGTSIPRLPPHCEVQKPGAQHGNMTARGDPASNGSQASAVQPGLLVVEEPQPEVLATARHGEGFAPTGSEFEIEWCKAEVARLSGLMEERDLLARSLRAELKEVREERDLARRELSEARLELERYCGGMPSPSLSRSLPSVPRSWQPQRHDAPEARAEVAASGGSASISNGRSGERPVEVRVSVPRAMTPDELMEEASREERRTVLPVRSVRSLAQAVVRMPSAPHPLTSHSASSQHSGGTVHILAQGPVPVPTVTRAVISYRR